MRSEQWKFTFSKNSFNQAISVPNGTPPCFIWPNVTPDVHLNRTRAPPICSGAAHGASFLIFTPAPYVKLRRHNFRNAPNHWNCSNYTAISPVILSVGTTAECREEAQIARSLTLEEMMMSESDTHITSSLKWKTHKTTQKKLKCTRSDCNCVNMDPNKEDLLAQVFCHHVAAVVSPFVLLLCSLDIAHCSSSNSSFCANICKHAWKSSPNCSALTGQTTFWLWPASPRSEVPGKSKLKSFNQILALESVQATAFNNLNNCTNAFYHGEKCNQFF